MLKWAFKSLWLQKFSTLTSATGVAAAFILVLILDAVFRGESEQIVAYIRHTQPDVWVMQGGVSNMHMASSYVLDWKVDKVRSLPGVEQVTPILYMNTMLNAGGRDWFAYIVGLQEDSQRAGPWNVQGSAMPGPGEIIIPIELSIITGTEIGDSVTITDRSFTVIGMAEGTFSMANSVSFVTFPDLEAILSSFGTNSYMLVDAEPGQDPVELAALIEREVSKVSALTQQQFVNYDFEMAMMMGVEIIVFMVIIGSILAALIVAFTTYSQVARQRHELAVAKALGVSNQSLYISVVIQATTLTILGLVIAVILAVVTIPLISTAVPQVTLILSASTLFRTAIIAILVALLAALIPAYLIAKVDPASAFMEAS